MQKNNGLYRQRLQRFLEEVTVYPVSCQRLARGRSDLDWLDGVLAGGAKIVQLRDKESSGRELFEKARIFRERTLAAGALFMVNDRLDIALACEADGVHLGNSDLPVDAARRLAPDLLIGVSCNHEEEAASAEERGASYYNIGPLYHTQTKDKLTAFLGPEGIAAFHCRSPLPFTVMGGIKKEHIPTLIGFGAQRLAVVTALTEAEDIAAETAEWIRLIKAAL